MPKKKRTNPKMLRFRLDRNDANQYEALLKFENNKTVQEDCENFVKQKINKFKQFM